MQVRMDVAKRSAAHALPSTLTASKQWDAMPPLLLSRYRLSSDGSCREAAGSTTGVFGCAAAPSIAFCVQQQSG